MTFPVESPWRVSAGFDELRPLANPRRPHGAVDLAVPVGTPIRAPESGICYWHLQIRNGEGGHDLYWPDGVWYAFSNYMHDVFGGLLILEGGSSKLTHVFAHVSGETIIRMLNERAERVSYSEDRISYLFSNLDHGAATEEGEVIGYSGNAGLSTGPHVHYEIHNRRHYTAHEDRQRPEELWEELKKGDG